MRYTMFPLMLLLGWISGCAAPPAAKPVEVLDERTGMTVASLKEPIELLPGVANATLQTGHRTTFAYLGPVEWDRMGTIVYGLWVHVAPGNDRQLGDIHAAGAVTLLLDDGPLLLSAIDAPKLGREPYHPVVSWGQSVYFDLNVASLARMARSSKLELDVPAADGSVTSFNPTQDTRGVLTRYAAGRGIDLQ